MKKLFSIALIGLSLVSAYEYKGCYADSSDRDLSGYSFSSQQMTIDDCATLCEKKGFKYMGLQYSSSCFCGNDVGRYGQSNNCNMPCSGEKDKICGGFWANSVYELKSNNKNYFHTANAESWFNKWNVVATIVDANNNPAKISNSNQRFGWKSPVRNIGDAMPPSGAYKALYIHPISPTKPSVLTTNLFVTPQNKNMRIRIAGNKNGNFTLKVKVNGKIIFSKSVDGSKWHNYDISLDSYMGQRVNIEVDIVASGWAYEYAFIDEITFSK